MSKQSAHGLVTAAILRAHDGGIKTANLRGILAVEGHFADQEVQPLQKNKTKCKQTRSHITEYTFIFTCRERGSFLRHQLHLTFCSRESRPRQRNLECCSNSSRLPKCLKQNGQGSPSSTTSEPVPAGGSGSGFTPAAVAVVAATTVVQFPAWV